MRRTFALVLALGLTVSACDGDAGRESQQPERDTPTATATPPTPSESLGLREGWGPDAAELDRAARAVGRMRLPDLAGQLIVAQWRGTQPPVTLVRSLHLGGVIAFADNVASAAQVRAVNTTLTTRVRRRWPLFLSVDQEGGVVERLRGAATRFPAFMSAGAARDAVLTQSSYAALGAELRGLGFTVDFAPDADVTSGPTDPTIGSRSVSSDPLAVAEHVTAAAMGYAARGVVPVVKHFPGHGSVSEDSHLTLPVQRRSRAELEKVELVPFAAAAGAGLPAVMVGHLDVRAVDPRRPSSLSRKVVTGLLRHDLGFDGLVVTDSLSMAAVTRGRTTAGIAVAAVRAGADVLLMPASPRVARDALVRAVRRGDLPRRRLEQAAARQIALLRHFAGHEGARPGSARAASRKLSAAAVTLVAGPCQGALVDTVVHPYGDPSAVAAFSSAAGAAGLTVLQRRTPPRRLTRDRAEPQRRAKERRRHFRKRHRRWERRESERERRLARWESREDARLAAGTAIGFVGYRDAPVDGAIAVATDAPWVLGSVTAPVRIATYGDTPGAMWVLVEVLLGRAPAPGRLPVRVRGVERAGC